MSPRAKREVLEAVIVRYRKPTRQAKTAILNELCETCGYHRKHAVRLLATFRRFNKPVVRKRGREQIYLPEELFLPLRRVWKKAYMPCSKRLKTVLPIWLRGYAERYGPLPLPVVNAPLRISPATIDRILKPVRAKYRLNGRATTKPGTLLKKHIPVMVDHWDEKRAGVFWKSTPYPIVEALPKAFMPLPSTAWISPPPGPSSGRFGAGDISR